MALIDCAKCCTIFSFFAMVFLGTIASLLHTQPLYFKIETDSETASKGCYSAATIYFVTLVVSLAYWFFDDRRRKSAEAAGPSAFSRNHSGTKYGSVISTANGDM